MKIEFEGSLNEFRSLFHGAFVPPLHKTLEEPSPYDMTPLVKAAHPPSRGEELRAEMLAGLPQITDVQRAAAWAHFVAMCKEWVVGFGDLNAVQPDRLELLRDLGTGAWPVPVLVMAYELGGLQLLVEKAFTELWPDAATAYPGRDAWLDYVEQVAGNMVQISHMAFPDIAGTYDHSSKWRKQ